MRQGMALLSGIGLGAGLMYLLDPDTGKRRRSLVRDQVTSAVNDIAHGMDMTGRDVRQRMEGLLAEAQSWFAGASVSDDVLVERVRSKMGRCVSHVHAIKVLANHGRITLSGPILEKEITTLLACVRSVPGVKEVDNQLEAHESVGTVPALQGSSRKRGAEIDLLQANWSPATRLMAGLVGCGLMSNCLARRTPSAALFGTAGLGLFVRALTNLEWKRLTGAGAGRRAIDVHKSITIAAPLEEVFELWANYENFPRFMAHLSEVRDLGGGRSRWVVSGPAGMPFSWTAKLTRFDPYELLAWRSEPGSDIANAGMIRFQPLDRGTTRVDIHLSYNPPAGALGHLAVSLFGADAKSAMNEDLLRLKSLLEQGKASAPGKQLTRQELSEMPETVSPRGTPAL